MSSSKPVGLDGAGVTLTHAPAEGREPRFAFGENWRRFLSVLDDERIGEAQRSLREMLGCDSLAGLSFLDLGCGSGLFSLAAVRLRAARVHSVDIDPDSVACAEELRERYGGEAEWRVERGSVLDRDYIQSLGTFDIVYSWGVLHHTGAMHTALAHAAIPVAPGGRLFIMIYNDQGRRSRRWQKLKRVYTRLPPRLRTPYTVAVIAPREAALLLRATLALRPDRYVREWTDYRRRRGMSRWHDIVDWVGGYPFEFARPEEIFEFYRERGFQLVKLLTRQGSNEFVFERPSCGDGAAGAQQLPGGPASGSRPR